MPSRIPDHIRAAIIEAIQAGGTCRGIAAEYGVSPSTVALIAKQSGLTDAFARTGTKRATEAKVADNKALRAEVSAMFLEKARQLVQDIDKPFLAFSFGGRDNTYNEHQLERAPTGDIRNLMVSAGVAFDKHLAADRHDSDEHGLSAVDTWLRDMLGN